MHGHVSKPIKMHRKPTSGANKRVSIALHGAGKGERYSLSNRHHGDASQMATSKLGLMGIRCNHTTINPLRVSNVAKPRTREASTSMEDKA